MHRRERALIVLAAAAAGVVSVITPATYAATKTFDNGGGDQLWSNPTNWNTDGAVDGNDAKFNATASSTAQLTVTSIVDANRSVLSLGYNQVGVAGGSIYHTTQINDGVTLTLTASTGANGSTMFAGSGVAAGGGTDQSFTSFQNQNGAVTGGTLD